MSEHQVNHSLFFEELNFTKNCLGIIKNQRENLLKELEVLGENIRTIFHNAQKARVSKESLANLKSAINEITDVFGSADDQLCTIVKSTRSESLNTSFNLMWLSRIERLSHVSLLAAVTRIDAIDQLSQILRESGGLRFNEYKEYRDFASALKSAIKACNLCLVFEGQECAIFAHEGGRGQGAFRFKTSNKVLRTTPTFPGSDIIWLIDKLEVLKSNKGVSPKSKDEKLMQQEFVNEIDLILKHEKNILDDIVSQFRSRITELVEVANHASLDAEYRQKISNSLKALIAPSNELSISIQEVHEDLLSKCPKSNDSSGYEILPPLSKLKFLAALAKSIGEEPRVSKHIETLLIDWLNVNAGRLMYENYKHYRDIAEALRKVTRSLKLQLVFEGKDCGLSTTQGSSGSFQIWSNRKSIHTSRTFPKLTFFKKQESIQEG